MLWGLIAKIFHDFSGVSECIWCTVFNCCCVVQLHQVKVLQHYFLSLHLNNSVQTFCHTVTIILSWVLWHFLLCLHLHHSVQTFWHTITLNKKYWCYNICFPSYINNPPATYHGNLPIDLERFEQDRETFCTGSAKSKKREKEHCLYMYCKKNNSYTHTHSHTITTQHGTHIETTPLNTTHTHAHTQPNGKTCSWQASSGPISNTITKLHNVQNQLSLPNLFMVDTQTCILSVHGLTEMMEGGL